MTLRRHDSIAEGWAHFREAAQPVDMVEGQAHRAFKAGAAIALESAMRLMAAGAQPHEAVEALLEELLDGEKP